MEEEFDFLPKEVKEVINRFSMMENDYESCENLKDALKEIGWTCSYGLDAEPYYFRKIS